MASRAVKMTRAERGMSLFETLLAVGVTAVFFAFVINIGNIIAREQAIQAAANYVNQIDQAMNNGLKDPNNFAALYGVLQAAGGQGQATINDLRAGTGILNVLPPSPLLGATFPDPGPLNQTYRILLRIADNMANPNDIPVIETFIASQTLVSDDYALRISGALGGKGGALRDTPNLGVGMIRGAFANWSAPILNLNMTGWFGAVAAAAPPTVNNGGYVVAYHYYDQQRIAKDYLYRINVAGNPNLNRMQGDLDMNNYNVLGVDNIATSGTLTSQQMRVQGNMIVSGDTAITGNMQSDGNSTITGNIEAPGNLALSVNGGTLQTDTATANNALFSSTLDAKSMTTNQLSANRVAMSNGNWNTSGVSSLNAGTGPGGIVVSGPGGTSIGGAYKTTTLDSNNVSLIAGNTGTLYMQTTGDYDQLSGSTQTGKFVGASQNRVGNSDWRCGDGCGDQ